MAVLGELDELLSAHPLRERLHAQRMLALYRSGNQAEALEAFRDARRMLLDEVGLEPGRELRELNDAMLRQDPALDGPPARAFPGREAAAPMAVARRRRSRDRRGGRLAATQLAGSGGLDGISEDAVGVVDPESGHIFASPSRPRTGGARGGRRLGVDRQRPRWNHLPRRPRGQVTTIDVGGEPTALAYGAGSLWVADGQNRFVDQIDSERTASSAAGRWGMRRAGWRSPAARCGSPRRSMARSSGSTSPAGGATRASMWPEGRPPSLRAAGRCGWRVRATRS